jgi:mitochondrial intermediate peptidase
MLLRTPFRFRGCLLSIARKESRKASFAIPPSVDDNALLEFFNTSHKPVSGTSTGLFRHKQITSPDAFIPVAMATMSRANYIVRRIINAREEHGTQKIVKNIDRLSDLLCGIIDMAELVRHIHPEKAWVDAANNAYDILCEYMNELNTNMELAAVCLTLMRYNVLSYHSSDP